MTDLHADKLESLAEHLCARRPCGDTPENVADWLAYSLQRCGLSLVEANTIEALQARLDSRDKLLHESLYHLRLDDRAHAYHKRVLEALNGERM